MLHAHWGLTIALLHVFICLGSRLVDKLLFRAFLGITAGKERKGRTAGQNIH